MRIENGNIVESWKARFRHSAGRLGSEYLRALRDDARILGWRIDRTGTVHVPPKDFGEPGAFVEVGPGARLLTLARDVSFASEGGRCVCLGRVVLDGASTPLFARIAFAEGAAPQPGARVGARFAAIPTGAATDYWVEPEDR